MSLYIAYINIDNLQLIHKISPNVRAHRYNSLPTIRI